MSTSFLNSTGLCQCAPGFFTNYTGQLCQNCHPACAMCEDSTDKCVICSQGYFRVYDNRCVKTCPIGYVGDIESGICVYAPPELTGPFADLGCKWHEFYNIYNETCESCDATCLTCYGKYETDCFTCPRGKYLSIPTKAKLDRYCVPCHSTAMYYSP